LLQDHYGREPVTHRHIEYETIEALARLDSVELVASKLMDVIPALGFPTFVLRETPAQTAGAQPIYVIDKSPLGWRETYIAEGFYKTDHVVRHGRVAARPFSFESAPYRAEEEAVARKFIDAASVYAGLKNGIVIPTPPWRTMSAAGAILRCEPDTDPEAIRTAEVIVLYAAYRLRALIRKDELVVAPRLSPREREVLQWTAQGKTAWEIGEILKISEGVVNKFIAHAMTKLNAVSKPQAIAKAIRFGEIDLV
jgi:LuxR family transcriptional regulator, quorum-sensing system regulator BjaR1